MPPPASTRRDPEVGDQRAARAGLEQDVLRLDVPVHDALEVRVSQRPRDLLEQLRRFARRQRSAGAHPLGQRFALDVRHHEEDEVADLLDGIDGDDVGVGEPGRGLRLAQEPLPERGLRRHGLWQELDRHRPVERDVTRQEDDAHPAAAQLALQGVPADERLLEGDELGGDGVGHGGVS